MLRFISEKFPDLLTASEKLSQKFEKLPLHNCAMDVLRRRADPPAVSVHAGTENVYTMCSLTYAYTCILVSINILFAYTVLIHAGCGSNGDDDSLFS